MPIQPILEQQAPLRWPSSDIRKGRQAAIFLDRDGTLNVECGYFAAKSKFLFIPGVVDACAELRSMGYLLVVVTNQSGIARGYFSQREFISLSYWMGGGMACKKAPLEAIYYCPHPSAVSAGGADSYACPCRKPQPGLILTAERDLGLDLARSYMVGDGINDLRAGRAAGVGSCVLVRSGHKVGIEAMSEADLVLDSLVDLPQFLRQPRR